MFDTADRAEGNGDDRLLRALGSLDLDQVAVLADLAETLAGDPRSRTAGELTDSMRSLDRVHAVLDAATLGVWSAWEDTMAFTDDGYAAPGSWINANLCVRSGVARYQVGLARKLRSGFPHVGSAAASGRLGRSKVELLVKARVDDVADEFDAEEADLVDEVAVRTVEAADTYLRTWRMEVLERLRRNEGDKPPPPEPEASELQMSPILDERMMIRGDLSPHDAALLSKAINDRIDQWYSAGLLADDTRSRRQLQAAALMELVRDGTAPANRGNGARPLTLALIDADTLTARAADHYKRWLERFMGAAGIDWPGSGPPPEPPNAASGGASAPPPRRNTRRKRDRGASGPGRGNRPQAPPWWPTDQPPIPDLFGDGASTGPDPTRAEPAGYPHEPEHTDPARAAGGLGGVGGVGGVGGGGDDRGNGAGGEPESVAATLDDIRHHLADLTRFAATSPVAERMRFRSELVGAGAVDPALIEELICCGDLVPVLHRNHTEILEMGRTVRLATPAQRKALLVRSSGTCEWPGCSIPHGWCDAHHLHYWENDGPTDLSNLALVCNHHHQRFHRAGYTGLVTTTGLEVLRPDGTPVQPTLSGSW